MQTPDTYKAKCLNCREPLGPTGHYCIKCGQRARSNPLPLKEFMGDFVQDYFTVDAKFFRSVRLLFTAPGLMTRRFNEGERLSFIAPFRFYIFVSVLYFFLLALNTRDSNFEFLNPRGTSPEAQLAQLDSLVGDTISFNNTQRFLEVYRQIRAPKVDSLNSGTTFFTIDDEDDALAGTLSNRLEERWKALKENPERFKQSLFKAVSIGVFFLLPIFALILMLTHARRSKFYVNHLVFSVHYHTFLFLIFSIYLLLGMWSAQLKHWLLLAIILAYLFLTARQVWKQAPAGWFRRTAIVLFFLLFILLLLPVLLSEPGGTDVFLVFALSSVYLTLSLMNAYKQSFLKAIVKHVLIMPVYTVVIALTLLLVAVAGVLLS